MNRQQRRRQKMTAAKLAANLVEHTKNQDWRNRFCAYGVTVQGILARGWDEDEAEALICEFSTAVVEAFGSPPITCAEQMMIWGGSHRYVNEAKAWLAAQGGSVTSDRGDGELLVLHEVDGQLVFTPLPSSAAVMH